MVLAGAAGALGSLDTALNIAFPDLLDDLGLEVADLQWVVVTYVLAYGASLLAAGQIGDLIDHRLLVRMGAAATAVSLAACALAPGLGWLLAARVAQGLGTALVMAGAPALATEHTAGAPALATEGSRGTGRALGVFTAATGVGAAAGPAMGGPLVELGGWPAVFWFRVPLALAVVGLALVAGRARPRPGGRAGGERTSDLGGAALIALVLVSVLLVVGSGRALGARSPALWIALAVAVVAVLAYRRRALAHPAPVLDPRSLAGPLGGLAALAVAANGAMFVAWLLVPTLVVEHLHRSTVVGGLTLAAAPLTMGLVATATGRLVDRVGPWTPLAVGLGIEGLGLGWLASASPDTTVVAVAAALAVVGVGAGVFGVANLTAVLQALPDDRRGTTGGLALLLRTVGIVVGVAAWAALFDGLEPVRGFEGAFRSTTAAAAAVALVAAPAAVVLRRR